jgi:hypothetical protein
MKPRFEGIDSVYKSKADNKDIRDLLERLVPKAKAQMVEFSQQFKGRTEQETCKKIFDYLKNNFTYVADGEEQIIKLPSALLAKKVGDCKSYSLFTSGILENLGIPYHFVYASYTTNPIPGHVYVTTDKGCIIDAVYGIFNQEKKPNYKYKKNMNVRYMAGMCTDCNTQGLGETWWQRQQRLAREAAAKIKAKVKDVAQDVGQGIKTAGLAPGRALILLMIKNNLDGFASKLQAINTTAFSNKWRDLGGDRTILTNAIKTGASKPEKKFGLLPKLKKITANVRVTGIGQVVIPAETKAALIGACTAAGTAIGGAPQGTAAGATAGTIIVELLPTLITIFQRTPDSTDSGFVDPGTGFDPNAEGTTPPTPGAGMNLNTILPIVAVVAAGGIYLATRKK